MPLTADEKNALRDAAGRKCTECTAPEQLLAGGRTNLHVHHRVRVKDGGTDDPENLQVLCNRCHSRAHSDLRPEAARKAALTRESRKPAPVTRPMPTDEVEQCLQSADWCEQEAGELLKKAELWRRIADLIRRTEALGITVADLERRLPPEQGSER